MKPRKCCVSCVIVLDLLLVFLHSSSLDLALGFDIFVGQYCGHLRIDSERCYKLNLVL